ncbi:MAG: signal peptidase I [Burkholderiaceae bacterium]|nr:MAG: signal peptidase I [Burkholderiaceae bacterium]
MGVIFVIAITVFVLAGFWKVFEKAGQPGWGALVPIYNGYLMAKVAGRPGWWLILMFIPLVNFIIAIILSLDIAKKFGQGAGFGIGLLLLGFIFYPILGFGDAVYQNN